jgi:hypothetical protein
MTGKLDLDPRVVAEATAELVRVGTRSREIEFTAQVLCRATPERSPSAADVLAAPVVVVRARGTVVIPDRVRDFSGVSLTDTPLTRSDG